MRAESHANPGKRTIVATLLAALAIVLGCGGPANKYDSVVTGTVTIDGQLASSGTVTFHPQDKSGKIAIGRIYPDGSFSLRTGQGDLRESDGGTVASGEYVVTVSVTGPAVENTSGEGGPPTSGPLLIDERYVSSDTSDLRYNVKPGENVATFDLAAAKPADEPADAEGAAVEQPAADDSAPAESTDSAVVPSEQAPVAEPAANPSEPEPATVPPEASVPAETTTPPAEGAPQ
jgi:hypothetical protein